MSRIQTLFEHLQKKREKALITYITAGDPDISATALILKALAENGADMIELGVPFSDPMADGPTIQAASQRALKNPFSLTAVFDLVKQFRLYSQIPVILFGYYNPFFKYGLDRLARDAGAAGADGFLVVDLPPEEAEDLKKAAEAYGLDTIFLLAPTSTDDRMKLVAQKASGFIYYVSVTGVTGARDTIAEKMEDYVCRIKKFTELPVGIGFGISQPSHIRDISRYADAVIVGSAIIKVIESYSGTPQLIDKVSEFVRSLKEATR